MRETDFVGVVVRTSGGVRVAGMFEEDAECWVGDEDGDGRRVRAVAGNGKIIG